MDGMDDLFYLDGWALVLGASSGFGAAASLAFARAGMNVIGVHFDRHATMPRVDEVKRGIESFGREALFFNVNAADERRRRATLDELRERFDQRGEDERIRVLLHSLAFGTLKPYWTGDADDDVMTKANVDMTLDVMAHSLLYWTQDVLRRGLFGTHARVFAMSSSGSHAVWPAYGAVSAAKAALEAHVRQLAVELAPLGATVNAINAGVCDTPALRKIPDHETMIAVARRKNPHHRLTTPGDVASALLALATPATHWMTGNIIRLDGGEDIAG